MAQTPKTVINIKADKKVKEEAQKLAKEIGIPLSTVINAYLKQFVREREVHVRAPLTPSPKLEKILDQAEKDIKTGKNLSPRFKTVEEALEYLHS